jgi:hypothetical protein
LHEALAGDRNGEDLNVDLEDRGEEWNEWSEISTSSSEEHLCEYGAEEEEPGEV